MMIVAGATTVPYMKMGNSKHLKSDGTTIKTFSTWTKEAGIYDGSKWNRYDSYVNTGSKKYKRAGVPTGGPALLFACIENQHVNLI